MPPQPMDSLLVHSCSALAQIAAVNLVSIKHERTSWGPRALPPNIFISFPPRLICPRAGCHAAAASGRFWCRRLDGGAEVADQSQTPQEGKGVHTTWTGESRSRSDESRNSGGQKFKEEFRTRQVVKNKWKKPQVSSGGVRRSGRQNFPKVRNILGVTEHFGSSGRTDITVSPSSVPCPQGTEIRGGLVKKKDLSLAKAERAEIAKKVLDWSRCVSKFSVLLPPPSRLMSTTANDRTSRNPGNGGNGSKGDGRGGRECSGSADLEKEAREKEEKRARREQEATAEAEWQEERDRRDAARDVEMEAAHKELEQLHGLLSIAGGPGGRGPGPSNALSDRGSASARRPRRRQRWDQVVPRWKVPTGGTEGRARSTWRLTVLWNRRHTRKPAKSPACRRIVKRRTIESEVEEVPPEVAEAGPWTRIDNLRVCVDMLEQRFERQYDDLMSRLQNFYRRSDMLLRRVRHAEDGAEISLEEIFEHRPDIAERWQPVADGLRKIQEFEEAEAEGSGDGESWNLGEKDKPEWFGNPEGRQCGPRALSCLMTAGRRHRKVLVRQGATGRRMQKGKRRRSAPS
ncbi:hypothetical protein FB451DRAFT_1191901 [Mycena latifolia]|nr:hypothetical protein FB451DRAFT_1191901 [Mycena latifolia]